MKNTMLVFALLILGGGATGSGVWAAGAESKNAVQAEAARKAKAKVVKRDFKTRQEISGKAAGQDDGGSGNGCIFDPPMQEQANAHCAAAHPNCATCVAQDCKEGPGCRYTCSSCACDGCTAAPQTQGTEPGQGKGKN